MVVTSRADCEALDARDPVRHLRDDFHRPPGVVYLDGNSLGMAPRDALARAAEVVEREWGRGLIRSWNDADWYDLPTRVGDLCLQAADVIRPRAVGRKADRLVHDLAAVREVIGG